MPELHYLLKRFLIILGYVILISVIGGLLYFFLAPKKTCSDGKKNQSEKEIDCGGPCAPCKVNYVGKDLLVSDKAFVSGGNNVFDVVAKISNPNDLVGASSFHYMINLKDEVGTILATREGDDYILPADSKYISQLGFATLSNVTPAQIDFIISDVKWSQLGKIERPQLSVYNRKFSPDGGGTGSKAEGLIRNESVNDFKKISVVVILRDEKGTLLGTSTTQKENVRAGQEVDFVLTWPYTFSAIVRNMEVDVQTNAFDTQNIGTVL